jgi:hypothetical protein
MLAAMGRLAGFVLAIAPACNGSLAGSDAPSGDVSDAQPAIISGRDVQRFVYNDMQHLPMMGEQPFASLTARVHADDGTWTPVAIASDGSFAFTAPAESPYRLELTANGGTPTELQLTSPQLDLAPPTIARNDRAPVPAGTVINVSLGNAGGGTTAVASTGVWGELVRQNGDNANFVVDWTQVTSGLLDANKYDRAYGFTYDNVGSPLYTAITNACSADVTLTGGTTNALACTLATVAFDHCMHLHAGIVAEDARVVAAIAGGPAYGTVGYSWQIGAVPAPSLTPGGALVVAAVGISVPPGGDFDRDQTYFPAPFPGHAMSLIMTVARQRPIQLTGTTTPLYFGAITQTFVAAAPDCSTVTDAEGGVAIAGIPALDGVTLASDMVRFTLDRTRPHELSWSIASPGAVDLWTVRLYSIVASGTTTTLAVHRVWNTTGTRIAFDPELLAAGTPYVFQIVAIRGYPGASTGDFRTIGYPSTPWGTAAQASAIFEVTN